MEKLYALVSIPVNLNLSVQSVKSVCDAFDFGF